MSVENVPTNAKKLRKKQAADVTMTKLAAQHLKILQLSDQVTKSEVSYKSLTNNQISHGNIVKWILDLITRLTQEDFPSKEPILRPMIIYWMTASSETSC